MVRRIKYDLETQGHDVWFDKNEIKFGNDWRRSFTNLSPPSPLRRERAEVRGESASNRVLSFLSKHSNRDPGVRLNEIGIPIGIKEGDIPRINDPLRQAIDGGRERYLIVMDALDEAVEAGRNPLVEMRARHTAPARLDWLRGYQPAGEQRRSAAACPQSASF